MSAPAAEGIAPARPGAAAPSGDGRAPVPPAYVHPQANRTARLGGHEVAYLLQRSRRRSIGFLVGSEGLCVRAPTWAALRDVDAALAAKAGWVCAKLQAQSERLALARAQGIRWGDGAVLPYLGAALTLQWVAGRAAPRLVAGDGDGDGDGGALHLRVGGAGPGDADAAALKRSVRAWLQREAARVFAERCALHMPRLGVRCTRLSLSSARTRWGSASTSGAIRLNWRLVHFALPTIDYVVVHELAHLREMNHGPAFWAIVEAALPGHGAARRALREAVLPVID